MIILLVYSNPVSHPCSHIVSIFAIHSFSGSSESDSGAKKSEMGSDHSTRAPSAAEDVEPASRLTSSSGSITTVLEIAGHTLGGAEADLVLNPLRLAFATKNIKMVELALDCLHVGAPFCL